MVVTFLHDIALIVTLLVLYGYIRWNISSSKFYYRLLIDLSFGAVAVAIMMMPLQIAQGIFLDGRMVVVALAGFWGGGVLSVILPIVYRITLGGVGMWGGVGTILFAGLTGVFFRYLFKSKIDQLKLHHYLLIGVVAHLPVLVLPAIVPLGTSMQVALLKGLAVFVIFSLSFAWIAKLFQMTESALTVEERIREAESLYRTTLQSIGDGVICTDINGRITQMNAVAEELTGWKFTESKGVVLEKVFRIIHEVSREKLPCPCAQVGASDRIFGVEKDALLVSKGGREIPIGDSVAPIKNEQGEMTGLVLVFSDQTQEREDARIILENEERFRKAVLMAPIPVIVNDEDGKVLTISAGWTDYSGYTLEDIPDIKTWTEKAYGEKAKEMEDYVSDLFEENRPIDRGIFEIETKTGEKRLWSFHTQSIGKLRNGKTILVSMAPDITEEARAKAELEDSEQLYRHSFEDHLAVKLLISPESGQIVKANQAAADFYGWSIEELQSMTIGEINTLTGEENKKGIEQTNSGTHKFFEFKHRVANGELKDVEVFSSQINYKGKELLHSIVQDVTDKKKFYRELVVAKEKAEESERMKSAFLANMSHEIRTPLNGIVGFSNLLAEDENLSQEERKWFPEIIKRSADGLLKIINDILDISKLEVGKATIVETNFEAEAMLLTLHSLFEVKLREMDKSDVLLVLEKPEQAIELRTDENRLMQIFSNLLDNALRFTTEGSVTFGVSEIKAGRAVFFVSDTGIGIAKEKHEEIFNRFSQADEYTSRSYGGTGLGLAIVKKLLHLMGSEITLESEPGKGTCFRFQLPYFSPTASVERASDQNNKNAVRSDKIRVLVVEDDPASSLYLRRILEKSFSDLSFAKTGSDALSLYETLAPDVILMDISLPDMSGLDVVGQIREKDQKVIIIAQTAYAMKESEIVALDAGCNDYITKPIKADVLVERIRKLRFSY